MKKCIFSCLLILFLSACQFTIEEPILIENNKTTINLDEGLYKEISNRTVPIFGFVELTRKNNTTNTFLGKFSNKKIFFEIILEPLDKKSLYIVQYQELDIEGKIIDYPALTILKINSETNIIEIDSIKIMINYLLDSSNHNNRKIFFNLLDKYNLTLQENEEKVFLKATDIEKLKKFLLELRSNNTFVDIKEIIFIKEK